MHLRYINLLDGARTASLCLFAASCNATLDGDNGNGTPPGSQNGTGTDGAGIGGMATGGVSGSGGTNTDSSGDGNGGGAHTSGGIGGAGAGGGTSAGGMGGGDSAAGGDNAGGSGGADTTTPVPSAGCGLPSNQPARQWVEQTSIMINGSPRQWSVWMPDNYDPSRAYPVVFLFHGCSSGTNNLPMQNVTGDDAILVRSTGSLSNVCWDWAPSDGVDAQLFDATVSAIEETRCVDTSRYFGVGYSSGSYFLSMLGCYRAHVLRAAASVAGGSYNPARTNCTGTLARMFVHDLQDNDNNISGSERERDRLLTLNECNTGAAPVPEAPAPCVRYQGCDPDHPIVFCATSGQGHNRQDSFAASFWNFFSEF